MKGKIRKYTIFCGGINEDGDRKSPQKINIFVDYIYKKCTLGRSGTSVLYIEYNRM
jgi:hypothetical protein